MVAGVALGHDYPALYVWASLTTLVCVAPLVHVGIGRALEQLPIRAAALRPVLRSRRLGELLVAQGALTRDQLRQLLDLQAMRDEGWVRLGDLAVAEGLITPEQLQAGLFPSGLPVPTPALREPQAA
jgi:hypothetical protein